MPFVLFVLFFDSAERLHLQLRLLVKQWVPLLGIHEEHLRAPVLRPGTAFIAVDLATGIAERTQIRFCRWCHGMPRAEHAVTRPLFFSVKVVFYGLKHVFRKAQ